MEYLKSRPEILSVLDKVTSGKNIKNYKITDVKTNAKGEGYLGEIFMISLKSEESDKELNLVIKAAFINDKIREMAPIRSSFENEIYYYDTVYPALKKFCKNRGIEKLSFAPEFFYGNLEEQPEVLVLENLKSSGFEIFDKKKVLDHHHVSLIFRNYGRYHAISMALRDQKPEEFYAMADNMNLNIFRTLFEKEHMIKYFVDMSVQAKKCLQPGRDDELLIAFEKYLDPESLLDVWRKAVDSNSDYPAILHGDCWSNNMLFKYENSQPVDMRLIDFQLLKLGSPVCDLTYFLYSGVDEKILKNFNNYLDEYYTSFSETAKKLGSDPEEIYPFEALKKDWIQYGKFGLIMTFQILRMKMTEQTGIMDLTDIVDAKDEESFTESFMQLKFNENEYNERVRAVVRHMYDLGAL